jgi:PhzF family phenazine biosynthesis protein
LGKKLNILRIAAFSDGKQGGNPAGVWIGDVLPNEKTMQYAAAEIGFSETVFAAPVNGKFRVRYFSPESEVPFCGHDGVIYPFHLKDPKANRFKSSQIEQKNEVNIKLILTSFFCSI